MSLHSEPFFWLQPVQRKIAGPSAQRRVGILSGWSNGHRMVSTKIVQRRRKGTIWDQKSHQISNKWSVRELFTLLDFVVEHVRTNVQKLILPMFPYRVKYTESEYYIQNNYLLYKIDQTCQIHIRNVRTCWKNIKQIQNVILLYV